MPSRKPNSHNDNMVILASWEALFDLIMGDPHGQTLEEKNIAKLDLIYGPGRDVDVSGVLKNDIRNR